MKTIKHLLLEIITLGLLVIALGYYWIADIQASNAAVILLFCLGVVFHVSLSVLERYPHKLNYPVKVTSSNKKRLYQLAEGLICNVKFMQTLFFAFCIVANTLCFHSSIIIAATILFFAIIMILLVVNIRKMFQKSV